MMEAVLDPIPVMSVTAVGGTKGAKASFDLLESRLPTLRGRKFYGTYNPWVGEYRACVKKDPGEDAKAFGLDEWTIPGGRFVMRKVDEWQSKMAELPQIFDEMAKGQAVDKTRVSVEFYRSEKELVLYLPIA